MEFGNTLGDKDYVVATYSDYPEEKVNCYAHWKFWLKILCDALLLAIRN